MLPSQSSPPPLRQVKLSYSLVLRCLQLLCGIGIIILNVVRPLPTDPFVSLYTNVWFGVWNSFVALHVMLRRYYPRLATACHFGALIGIAGWLLTAAFW